MKTFTCLLMAVCFSIAVSHAQTVSRLVAWTAYTDFYVSDSGYYTYTGTNGGDLTHLLNYSNETIYSYNPNPGADTFGVYEDVQESFNGNDLKTDSLTQFWSTAGWTNARRTLFNYNANNRDTFANYQTWDSTKWIGDEEIFYHYTNNYIDTVTTEDTSYLGGWVGNTKNSYAYNLSGDITDEVIEYWNLTNNNWFSFYNVQYIYNYDSFNNDTAYIIQAYDTAGTGSWVNQYKSVYTYDAHHNPITEVDLVWDTTALDTDGKFKTTYQYDANSNDTSSIEQQYNYNVAEWDTVITNSYTYNSYNQVTYHKSFNSDLFEPYSEIKYYYADISTGVNQLTIDRGQVTVYPNPASDYFYVSLILPQNQPVQLSLYNILGQEVYSTLTQAHTNSNPTATILVTGLAEGIYVLRVNEGNSFQQREIVVAR